jgi:hypothetical protein
MSDWFHGEWANKKLPLDIVKEMAKITVEYFRHQKDEVLPNLFLAGSHSPASNHDPEGESDIDFYVFYSFDEKDPHKQDRYQRFVKLSLEQHPYLKLLTGMEINVTFVPAHRQKFITTAVPILTKEDLK